MRERRHVVCPVGWQPCARWVLQEPDGLRVAALEGLCTPASVAGLRSLSIKVQFPLLLSWQGDCFMPVNCLQDWYGLPVFN